MAALNQCSFIGNVGRDPETRFLSNGDAVCNFSLAVTERWKKDGETQEQTEWVRCVAWRKLAEICSEYVKKGTPLFVQGKMRTRKWQDKDGQDRYSTEIHLDSMQMLGRREDGEERRSSSAPARTQERPQQPRRAMDDFDDGEDVPF